MKRGIKTLIYLYIVCWNIQTCFATNSELYYESSVSNDSCINCPEYLKLLANVHEIVGRTPTNTNISNENKLLTGISDLRFLYYESRVTLEDGGATCQIVQNQDPKNPSGLKRNRLSLLSEKVLENQSIKNFQIYPQNTDEEVRYYYRGSGIQNSIVVEVIVKKDLSATVRYYHYDEPGKADVNSISTDVSSQPHFADAPVSINPQASLK